MRRPREQKTLNLLAFFAVRREVYMCAKSWLQKTFSYCQLLKTFSLSHKLYGSYFTTIGTWPVHTTEAVSQLQTCNKSVTKVKTGILLGTV